MREKQPPEQSLETLDQRLARIKHERAITKRAEELAQRQAVLQARLDQLNSQQTELQAELDLCNARQNQIADVTQELKDVENQQSARKEVAQKLHKKTQSVKARQEDLCVKEQNVLRQAQQDDDFRDFSKAELRKMLWEGTTLHNEQQELPQTREGIRQDAIQELSQSPQIRAKRNTLRQTQQVLQEVQDRAQASKLQHHLNEVSQEKLQVEQQLYEMSPEGQADQQKKVDREKRATELAERITSRALKHGVFSPDSNLIQSAELLGIMDALLLEDVKTKVWEMYISALQTALEKKYELPRMRIELEQLARDIASVTEYLEYINRLNTIFSENPELLYSCGQNKDYRLNPLDGLATLIANTRIYTEHQKGEDGGKYDIFCLIPDVLSKTVQEIVERYKFFTSSDFKRDIRQMGAVAKHVAPDVLLKEFAWNLQSDLSKFEWRVQSDMRTKYESAFRVVFDRDWAQVYEEVFLKNQNNNLEKIKNFNNFKRSLQDVIKKLNQTWKDVQNLFSSEEIQLELTDSVVTILVVNQPTPQMFKEMYHAQDRIHTVSEAIKKKENELGTKQSESVSGGVFGLSRKKNEQKKADAIKALRSELASLRKQLQDAQQLNTSLQRIEKQKDALRQMSKILEQVNSYLRVTKRETGTATDIHDAILKILYEARDSLMPEDLVTLLAEADQIKAVLEKAQREYQQRSKQSCENFVAGLKMVQQGT